MQVIFYSQRRCDERLRLPGHILSRTYNCPNLGNRCIHHHFDHFLVQTLPFSTAHFCFTTAQTRQHCIASDSLPSVRGYSPVDVSCSAGHRLLTLDESWPRDCEYDELNSGWKFIGWRVRVCKGLL